MDLRWPGLFAAGLLVSLGVVLALHFRARRRSRVRRVPVANSAVLTRLPQFQRALSRHRARMAALAGGATLLVVASLLGAARPVATTVQRPESRSRDIMLCLDVSGSMGAHDARLVRTFRDLVTSFRGERVGLVIFNSSAATVFPLTDDYEFINDELDNAEQALSGANSADSFFAGTFTGWGTSLIGDGLATCVTSFDRADVTRARSVILATDNEVAGRQLVTVAQAGDLARAEGIRIYGLNPEANGPNAEAVQLRQIVVGTGGRYYAMADAAAIPGIVASVQSEEATLLRSSARTVRSDDPGPPVAVAGLMLGLVIALRRRWRS
jgi:Ca-activated chloride channel homolog